MTQPFQIGQHSLSIFHVVTIGERDQMVRPIDRHFRLISPFAESVRGGWPRQLDTVRQASEPIRRRLDGSIPLASSIPSVLRPGSPYIGRGDRIQTFTVWLLRRVDPALSCWAAGYIPTACFFSDWNLRGQPRCAAYSILAPSFESPS
jgi:hypothetical protein